MGSQRNADNRPNNQNGKEITSFCKLSEESESLRKLITWNISKALENNPHIDLRESLRETQKLWDTSYDIKALVSSDAYNLSCALLAWQQLGHRDADSLFNFVEQSLKNDGIHITESSSESVSYTIDYPKYSPVKAEDRLSPCVAVKNDIGLKPRRQCSSPAKIDFSTSVGLVLKLPAEPQTVVNVCGSTQAVHYIATCCASRNKLAGQENQRKKRFDVDEDSKKEFVNMDTDTAKLRSRAAHLVTRGAERTEQLERAEMAWRDLEAGYQRRLQRAKEKEDDIKKETAIQLKDRDGYKAATEPLIAALKKAATVAEKKGGSLLQQDQRSCGRACDKHSLLKRLAEADRRLAEIQSKVAQFDRDLALKEEQERRKQRALTNALDSARLLVHEAQFAQRTELSALREQVKKATDELLEDDALTSLLKDRIADKTQEKEYMINNMETCQANFDSRKEEIMSNLNKMKLNIADFENEMAQCLCKQPTDKAVEAKRTPSLVAQCQCPPNESVEDTCSCASLRSRLMSTLLRDWFGGLTLEIEEISSNMSCNLLKCLEDKHNWDRPSAIKKEVGAFFSQLLLKELDIAIATSIEKNYEEWVGACHIGETRLAPCRDSRPGQGNSCKDRELEMMANKIAEKLFQERARDLAAEAEDILREDGLITCDCNSLNEDAGHKHSAAVYRCLVQPNSVKKMTKKNNKKNSFENNYGRKIGGAIEVRQRMPVNNVKKEERGTAQLVHTVQPTDKNGRSCLNHKSIARISNKINNNVCKPVVVKRSPNRSIINKNVQKNGNINNTNPVLKCPEQYAVSICFCNQKNNLMTSKSHEVNEIDPTNSEEFQMCDMSNTSSKHSVHVVNITSTKDQILNEIQVNQPQNILAVNIENEKHYAVTSARDINFEENLDKGFTLDDEKQSVQISNTSVGSEIKNIKYADNDTETEKECSVAMGCNGPKETLHLLNSLNPRTVCKDYDNCIKCLGVTLTNTILERSFKKITIKESKSVEINRPKRHNKFKSEFVILKKNVGNKNSPNVNVDGEKKFGVASPTNKCENNIIFLGVTTNEVTTNEGTKLLNSDVDNSDNEPLKPNTYNHSQSPKGPQAELSQNKNFSLYKSIDIQESCRSNESKNSEACVCCPHSHVNNPSDLEINTFQLLEEHLKRQLEDFKLSVCKSSCMNNEDEKTLVNDTLLRVKRLILQNASIVTNNCIENNKFCSATWNRAHSLLQEYLKTKIKRIKCKCNTFDLGNGKNMVTHVLNDISRLIEDDLQQLTKFCKCKNTTSISIHVPEFMEHACITIPVHKEQNDISKSESDTLLNKQSQDVLQHSVVSKSRDDVQVQPNDTLKEDNSLIKE